MRLVNKEKYKTTVFSFEDSIYSWMNVSDSISSDLPYSVYTKRKDSLQKIEDKRRGKDRGKILNTWSLESWFGITQYSIKKLSTHEKVFRIIDSLRKISDINSTFKLTKQIEDSINKVYYKDSAFFDAYSIDSGDSILTYLTLDHFIFDNGNKDFFIKNNQNFFAIPHYKVYGDGDAYVTYTAKPAIIKYIGLEKWDEGGTIFIPISTAKAKWYAGLTLVGVVFLITGLLCVILVFPIIIIFNISRGKPFIFINRRLLNISALMLATVCFMNIVVPLIMNWIYAKYIPSDLIRIYPIGYMLWFCLASILLYTIGLAFKKGAKLQQETDLTI